MKKILLLGLAGVFFFLAADAKDGPFPIFQSLGIWVTPARNFELRISVVKRLDSETALVRVIARSLVRKDIVSSGFVIYKLSSPTLDIVLRNAQGKRFQIILKPFYADGSNGKRQLDLLMDLIELDTDAPQSVPTKLIKQ